MLNSTSPLYCELDNAGYVFCVKMIHFLELRTKDYNYKLISITLLNLKKEDF